MASSLVLEIVTPFGKTFSSEVKNCTIPGKTGQFQILRDHATLIAEVVIGPIKIEQLDSSTNYLATSGGFCEVKDNRISIIAESAEFSDKINIERAESARDRAQKRLQTHDPDVDLDRARISLMRALNRLKVARLR